MILMWKVQDVTKSIKDNKGSILPTCLNKCDVLNTQQQQQKEVVLGYMYNRIVPSHKKEWSFAIWNSMNRLRLSYAE